MFDGREKGQGIVKMAAPQFGKKRRKSRLYCPEYDEDRGRSFLVDGEVWRCVKYPPLPKEWVGKTVLYFKNKETKGMLCDIDLVDSNGGPFGAVRLILSPKADGLNDSTQEQGIKIEDSPDRVLSSIRFVENDEER